MESLKIVVAGNGSQQTPQNRKGIASYFAVQSRAPPKQAAPKQVQILQRPQQQADQKNLQSRSSSSGSFTSFPSGSSSSSSSSSSSNSSSYGVVATSTQNLDHAAALAAMVADLQKQMVDMKAFFQQQLDALMQKNAGLELQLRARRSKRSYSADASTSAVVDSNSDGEDVSMMPANNGLNGLHNV
jgi:hypothetical protein